MKGKLLSFDEVFNLKEGTKVWHYNDKIQVHEIRKVSRSIAIIENKDILYLVSNTCGCVINTLESYNNLGCKTYEWIDDNKILEGDKIRELPHGTNINFTDRLSEDICKGIINKESEWISYISDINQCQLFLDGLEPLVVKAWVIEEPKQETREIHKEVKLYNLVEMVEKMRKDYLCRFRDTDLNIEYGLIKGELQYREDTDREWSKIINHSPSFLLKKFIKIESKPVDFMTAIRSGKNIKVEHVYINNLASSKPENATMKYMVDRMKNNEYMPSNELLCALGWMTSTNAFNEIVMNGKWYIKQ